MRRYQTLLLMILSSSLVGAVCPPLLRAAEGDGTGPWRDAVAEMLELISQEREKIQRSRTPRSCSPALIRAIKRCERLRAPEFVPALLSVIDLIGRPTKPKGKFFTASGPFMKPGEQHPAVRALIVIGVPALDPLIDGLRSDAAKAPSHALRVREYLIADAIAAIAGPECGVRRLEQAIDREKSEKVKTYLSEVLDGFLGQGPLQQYADPEYQLFAGDVAWTLRNWEPPKPRPPLSRDKGQEGDENGGTQEGE